MKFEHTATLMAQSEAIARDRNQRAWAETMPVPSEREKSLLEFQELAHPNPDGTFTTKEMERTKEATIPHEPLDRIEFELFSEDHDHGEPVNLFPHDRPLFWLTVTQVARFSGFFIGFNKEVAQRLALANKSDFMVGICTMRDFCGLEM